MTAPINWTEKKVRVSSLRPYEENPRLITDAQFAKLKASFVKFGQFLPLLVTTDGLLIAGHQRIKAMKELEWTECRIWQADRELEDSEYKWLLLATNHNNGVFDMEKLANNFDLDFLQSIGLHEITNIAPMGDDEEQKPGRSMVCCPSCKEEFPVKGNKVK